MYQIVRVCRYCCKMVSVGLVVLFLGGCFVLLLAGCQEAPPPPPAAVKVEKTEPPSPTEDAVGEGEEAEEEPQEPEYTYDASGRREPFKTLVVEELPEVPEIIVTPDPELLKTALQKFEVSQLKLTGIILGGLGDYGRVVAPDGDSYMLNMGTLVGPHGGEVISITDNVIVVKETIHYESGKKEVVETPLYLNPIDEEDNP